MKTLTINFLVKLLTISFIVIMFFSAKPLKANQIDIGIFVSGANVMEVRIKPDFQINPDQIISDIRYTIKFPDLASIDIISIEQILPFDMILDANQVDGGFEYQTFVNNSAAQFGMTILPGEEVVISRFTYSGGPSAYFYIEDDDFVQNLINPEVFYNFEFICDNPATGICDIPGDVIDVTGIFYSTYATIPVSNWAILTGILLMITFMVLRFRRLLV